MNDGNHSLPASWVVAPLEEVVEIRDDLRKPVNSEERATRPGPYPYYGATGQVGWIDDFLMDGEYILLGEDGAPFLDPTKDKAYRVIGKSWVNNHAHVLLGRDGVLENRFLLHALNSTDYRAFANGTTRLKLTQGAMRRIPIPVAPQKEQQRIVEKIEELFSDLDAGVAALERAKANLKRYRAAVLKAAVEGKLTAAWRAEHPDVEPASKLLVRILAARRRNWEADQLAKFATANKPPPKNWHAKYAEPAPPDRTNLPELPISWCWATIEQLASPEPRSIQSGPFGSNLLHSEFQEQGILAIGIDNVLDGRFSLGSDHRISQSKFEELSKYEARPFDILITVMATVGRSCVVPADVERSIITKHVYRISPNPSLLNSHFAQICISGGAAVRRQIYGEVRGQTRPGINGEILRGVALPLPPLSEQTQIVTEVAEKLSQIEAAGVAIDHGLARAARLRQSILKRAFAGQLVPQDPHDEPATALLQRVRTNGSTKQAHRGQMEGARKRAFGGGNK